MNNVNDMQQSVQSTETVSNEMPTMPAPRKRGFAAMDRNRVKELASMGGKAAHASGRAHRFSHEEAVVAGRKGGKSPRVSRGRVHPDFASTFESNPEGNK